MLSVVVPAYNEETTLINCLFSIEAEADRTRRPYEIIVVDNNSTDSTATLARDFGVKVVSEPRKGVTRARQTGFEASKYDIVAFIDADSVLPKFWLDYAIQDLDDPRVVAATGPLVYPDISIFKRSITAIFYIIASVIHMFLPMTTGGNFIVKRSAFIQSGGFDTNIEFYGDDTDIAKKLAKVGKIVFDFNLFMYTSSRRMQNEGMIKMGLKYILNFWWMWIYDRPYTIKYKDHRDF